MHYVIQARAKKGELRCSFRTRTMSGLKQCPRAAVTNGKCRHHAAWEGENGARHAGQ